MESLDFADDFEINIRAALSDQLLMALEKLHNAPLNTGSISKLSTRQGIYQLFHKRRLVYVGSAHSLKSRLTDHQKKISGRSGMDLVDMRFNCLYVHQNWTALAPEKALINHYKQEAQNLCEWNGIGFGPHDPGRRRELTNKPPDGFDSRYPINAGFKCAWIKAGNLNCLNLLTSLKQKLPYLLRYETTPIRGSRNSLGVHYTKGHTAYNHKIIPVPRSNMKAMELLALIASHLHGWQATKFSSHVILYEEERDYAHGKILKMNRSPG